MTDTDCKLIITADDFGRSSSVNAAIVVAHCEGVLTSASLMVAGDAANEAVAIAKENPTLEVGLHLVCLDGKATLPPSEIPDIVDERGFFSSNPFRIGTKYFFNRPAQKQLHRELRAQFERFAATGLALSHVDSHWHFHMHPTIFPMVVELAQEFGAKRLRVPRDDLGGSIRRSGKRLIWKIVTALVFAWLNCRAMKSQTIRHSPLMIPATCYGLFDTGAMDEAAFLDALRHVDSKLTEIYFHPDTVSTGEAREGPEELKALLNEEAKRLIRAHLSAH